MDSTEFMRQARKYHNHYDAIILDPPRAGTTKDFIECATALNPRKILYISCDPRTQVRDLNQFRKQGYVTNKLELVDLFPYTDHIESVCVLENVRKQVCFLLCIWVCLNCLECYNLCNRTENIYVRNWNSST